MDGAEDRATGDDGYASRSVKIRGVAVLHEAAYALVAPHFEQDRRAAVERLETLLGNHDPRTVLTVQTTMAAARQGRVETLLLAEEEAPSHTDPVTGCDPLDEVVVQTLRHGGDIHVVPRTQLPSAATAAAILRY